MFFLGVRGWVGSHGVALESELDSDTQYVRQNSEICLICLPSVGVKAVTPRDTGQIQPLEKELTPGACSLLLHPGWILCSVGY